MPQEESSRIVALHIAPRFSGVVALDGFGVLEGGFRSWNGRMHRSIDRKARSLFLHVERLIRTHRPACIVLALTAFEAPSAFWLRKEIRLLAAALIPALPVEECHVRDARILLLGRVRGRGDNALPRAIVRGFFPDLAQFVGKDRADQRYRNPAFEAAAVAIATLVVRKPLSAAALALPAAFDSRPLTETLAHALGGRLDERS